MAVGHGVNKKSKKRSIQIGSLLFLAVGHVVNKKNREKKYRDRHFAILGRGP